MSFRSSFVPYQPDNLRLEQAIIFVRLWDSNNNNFDVNWLELGFLKEGVDIDFNTEKIEQFVGIPQGLLAQAISKVGATAKFNLIESGDIRTIAFAFGQQPITQTTSGTTARTEIFNNSGSDNSFLNNIFKPDSLNGFKHYWLAYQPVDNSTVVVTIEDSATPHNTFNVTNQFIISTLNGRTSLIPKDQTNIIDTSGLLGYVGPITKLTISYTQLNLQKQFTSFVADIARLNSPVRAVIIGKNLAAGTGELIAVRFSKAFVKLGGTFSIGKTEFGGIDVEMEGVVDYPAGVNPLDGTGNVEILKYVKYPSTQTISNILADLY